MTAPDPHPAWCQIMHGRGWQIHSGVLGEIVAVPAPAERAEVVLVEMNDFGDGRGALVTVGVSAGDRWVSADFNASRAREIATLLGRAADMLDGGAA